MSSFFTGDGVLNCRVALAMLSAFDVDALRQPYANWLRFPTVVLANAANLLHCSFVDSFFQRRRSLISGICIWFILNSGPLKHELNISTKLKNTQDSFSATGIYLDAKK
nr:hypothetical protein [Edwardsiella ictaluri]